MNETNVRPYRTYILFYRLWIANIIAICLVVLVWVILYILKSLPEGTGGAITFFNASVFLACALILTSGTFASARKNLIKHNGFIEESKRQKVLAASGRSFFIAGITLGITIMVYILWAIRQTSFWDSLR